MFAVKLCLMHKMQHDLTKQPDLHGLTQTAVAMEDVMVVISNNIVSIFRPRLQETEVLLFSALIQRD